MKVFYFGCAICLILMSACGQSKEQAVTEQNRIIKIKKEPVRLTRNNPEFHYSGTVEPFQTIPLSFENIGTVESVLVEEGDFVRKGQVLAIIDKADDITLSNATTAKYNQAKDAYDRLKSVYEKGSLPEIKWIEIETTLKEAESQMQLAHSSIKKCTMRAPVDGVIGKRNIEPGQNALTITAPMELVKIEKVYVKVSVAENEISKIKKGQKASFTISALDGKIFEGIVTNVGVVADEIARTYEVKILANNPNLEIKSGMVCDVNIGVGEEKYFLSVSNKAVSKDSKGKTYVFVLNEAGNSVRKQEIELGCYSDNGVEVKAGLSQGQEVVIEGKEKLSDNSLISF